MSWILLATLGQFLNAIVALVDKYIVSDEKALPRPFVYAFYSCLVTGGWVLVYAVGLIPGMAAIGVPHLSNVQVPSIHVVALSFLAAYTFFMALVSLYDALRYGDASDIMPVIGAVSAIGSFGMAYLFLGAPVTANFAFGVALLALGTFLVSQIHFSKTIFLHTVHSGIFFALHYVAMKGLFDETSFDDGFFWSRIAFVLFALSLLLVPSYYEKIRTQTESTSKQTGILVLANKILAGIAAFLLLKATALGDVAVVQALDGLKFVFIILLGLLIGHATPESAGENMSDVKTITRKVLYIIVITIGFIVLFV